MSHASPSQPNALSINYAINCPLLKTEPNVQQFLNVVNSMTSTCTAGQGSK